jgi:hypothetical protein
MPNISVLPYTGVVQVCLESVAVDRHTTLSSCGTEIEIHLCTGSGLLHVMTHKIATDREHKVSAGNY